MEIPKAMIVERIRSQQGAEKANEADSKLPTRWTPKPTPTCSGNGQIPDQLTDIAGGNPAVG